jgi:hypothetical protein
MRLASTCGVLDPDVREPEMLPQARAEVWLDRVLERSARVLGVLVSVLLIVFVAIVLIGVARDLLGPVLHEQKLTDAALRGLDDAFLAIILLEVVHTTLSRGPLASKVLAFLAIGITAGVRTGLEVAAVAPESAPRDVVIDLAIVALGVVLLAVAYVLVRHRLYVERSSNGASPGRAADGAT